MGRRIDFDAALAERDANLLTFSMGGRDWVVPPGDVDTLTAFASMVENLGAMSMVDQVNFVVEFITSQLAEVDREPFREMRRRVRPPLKMLGQLAEEIAMEVTGSPLDGPSRSDISARMRRLESGPISSSEDTLPPPSPGSESATGSRSPSGSSPAE